MSMVVESAIKPRDEFVVREKQSGLGAMDLLNLYLGDRLVLYQTLAAATQPDWAISDDDAAGLDR